MSNDHNLTVEERDARQAANSDNPEEKAASLVRARARWAEEIGEVQRRHDESVREREERRANTP